MKQIEVMWLEQKFKMSKYSEEGHVQASSTPCQGNHYLKERRLSTVDLLIKIVCFVKNIVSAGKFSGVSVKSSQSELVSKWRSMVLILPLQ